MTRIGPYRWVGGLHLQVKYSACVETRWSDTSRIAHAWIWFRYGTICSLKFSPSRSTSSRLTAAEPRVRGPSSTSTKILRSISKGPIKLRVSPTYLCCYQNEGIQHYDFPFHARMTWAENERCDYLLVDDIHFKWTFGNVEGLLFCTNNNYTHFSLEIFLTIIN